MNKNAVNFAVGCDSTVRKLVELAFIAGGDQSRWFNPAPPTTYMDMVEEAAREYATNLMESNAQSAQNVGRETRPSQGEAAGIRSAGPADTAQAEASRASFVECEYTGQRIDGKRLICELGRGHDGHHKMQRGETAWYFLPDSCHSVTERSARRDVATGTEMAGAENGHSLKARLGRGRVNYEDFRTAFTQGWVHATADIKRGMRTAEEVWEIYQRIYESEWTRNFHKPLSRTCPRDGCPYVGQPDFSVGNPCRCTELATSPSSDQGAK